MAIRIVPHSAELRDPVHRFNMRMREGGSRWGFYTEPVPTWIPPREGARVWREYHIAVDDQGYVRGGYALKPQPWVIRGEQRTVSDWQGPFSEGAISDRYAVLGIRMVRDMLRKQPLLFSWGHGGHEQPVVQMLRRMRWLLHDTPFCLLICHPRRFLRHNRLLRESPGRALALDALAFSGAGSLGLRALHATQRARRPRRFRAHASEVPRFGPWADFLWETHRDKYLALAVRDAAVMNTLLPEGDWPRGIRLRVTQGGRDLGWAVVMDTQMQNDERFGHLRVGSVVDCFADPDDAGEVAHAATRFLRARGVDLIMSNQAHPRWARGFAENGYIVLQKRRIFAASPALRQALEPLEETLQGLHLTNMDGHGPMTL